MVKNQTPTHTPENQCIQLFNEVIIILSYIFESMHLKEVLRQPSSLIQIQNRPLNCLHNVVAPSLPFCSHGVQTKSVEACVLQSSSQIDLQ